MKSVFLLKNKFKKQGLLGRGAKEPDTASRVTSPGGSTATDLLTTGYVDGARSWLAQELVDQSDVGKRSASHDLIMTSAGSVGVELPGHQSEKKWTQ